MLTLGLLTLSDVIALGSFVLSAIAVILSFLTYSRYRPAINITAQNLPPYQGEEKTIFTFENVGSGDIVNPESYVDISWEPSQEILLYWGETTVLAPGAKKVIECRLPDLPAGQYTIEVEVVAANVRLPKKSFRVARQ